MKSFSIPDVYNLEQAMLCARRQCVKYWCIGHSPLAPGLHYFFTSTPIYRFADTAWWSEQAKLFYWYDQPRAWSNTDSIGLKYDARYSSNNSSFAKNAFNVRPDLVAKGTKSKYWNWHTTL